MEKQPAVYLLASGRNGTLYTGVTANLVARTWQHREHVIEGFGSRYDTTRLVWYELHGAMESAIEREKRIKKWRRRWKIDLIEAANPYWRDLWPEILGSNVIAAKAGIQRLSVVKTLDSRFRGNDEQDR